MADRRDTSLSAVPESPSAVLRPYFSEGLCPSDSLTPAPANHGPASSAERGSAPALESERGETAEDRVEFSRGRIAERGARRTEGHTESRHQGLGGAEESRAGNRLDHRNRQRLQPSRLRQIAAAERADEIGVELRGEVVCRSDTAGGAGRQGAEERFVDAPRQVEATAGDV